jgi:hypothetical protein
MNDRLVLLVGGEHLVTLFPLQACEDEVGAIGRVSGKGDVFRSAVQALGNLFPSLAGLAMPGAVAGHSGTLDLGKGLKKLLQGRLGHDAIGAYVEVDGLLEDREGVTDRGPRVLSESEFWDRVYIPRKGVMDGGPRVMWAGFDKSGCGGHWFLFSSMASTQGHHDPSLQPGTGMREQARPDLVWRRERMALKEFAYVL